MEIKDRIIGLDVIRSMAILWVIYLHGAYLVPAEHYNWYSRLNVGIDGVSVFFVLSGFLIGRILIRNFEDPFGMKEIGHFIARRWFRTLPAYLIVLTTLSLYATIVLTEPGWKDLAPYFIFVQNIATPNPIFFREAWSLSIEEWFYIILPILLFILNFFIKNKKRVMLLGALILILIPLAFRIWTYTPFLALSKIGSEKFCLLYRADAIGFGVIGAWINYHYKGLWTKAIKKCLVFGIVGLIFFYMAYHSTIILGKYTGIWMFTLEALITLAFIPFANEIKDFRFKWVNQLVRFVSNISYSLYLVNFQLVLKIILPLLIYVCYGTTETPRSWFLYLVFILLTLAFAYGLNKLIEVPFMKIRDKVFIRK